MSSTMIVTTLAAGPEARRRLIAGIARGAPIRSVFFYSDGVEAAAVESERHAWQALAHRHRVALILCSASAARRGVVRTDGSDAPAGFETAGIGRFAELAAEADAIEVAGRA